MLCGCFPFNPECAEEQMLREINAAEFAFSEPGWKKLSTAALELCRSLLARDPRHRPHVEDVLQHPFCASAVTHAFERERRPTLAMKDIDAALLQIEEGD